MWNFAAADHNFLPDINQFIIEWFFLGKALNSLFHWMIFFLFIEMHIPSLSPW